MTENKFFFKVDNSVFSPQNPLIIAELGTSHNGDIKKAKKMIEAAAQASAGCVKFQMVFADEILHPNTGEVPLPGGKIRLYDKFKSLEMPDEIYAELKEFTESIGILFLCTPFGLKSASILKKMQLKMIKIASPELNYTSLLEEIAQWNLPTLLSTGVSTLADIEAAVNIFKGNRELVVGSCDSCSIKNDNLQNLNSPLHTPHSSLLTPHSSLHTPLCLLHCVTSYPAPETEYNLRLLPNLSAIFGIPTGVSDHSSDPELVPALAVSMGACVIEKHFCLSKSDPGLDDPIALPPDEFLKMTKAVKQAAKESKEETISRYNRERSASFVKQILGSGVKELSHSEKANYRLTNRSIHATRDIKKGETLKKSDYAVLRTEKILRPGLDPSFEKKIENRIAKNDIPSGEGIRYFEDI